MNIIFTKNTSTRTFYQRNNSTCHFRNSEFPIVLSLDMCTYIVKALYGYGNQQIKREKLQVCPEKNYDL